MKIDSSTILCATIAIPNRASRAPLMHNTGFEKLGIPYVYLAFEPSREGLPDAVAGVRGLGIRGFSVSKPFKQDIIPLLDELDPIARGIGAVNTVLNEDGKLIGYNSDWIGAADGIAETMPVAGKRVLLVGAGGAARAIAYGLREKGAAVTVYNRTPDRARELAESIGVEFGGDLAALRAAYGTSGADYDVLVNATSVGMHPGPDESPVPKEVLRPGKVVLDAVIFPMETRLVRDARAADCTVVPGARMLLLQGAFQFRLFTGHEPPLEAMYEAVVASLR